MKVTRYAHDGFDVAVWQGGDGPPLLYLHGIEHHPGDARFLQRLGEFRAVHAPEHPGHGSSTGQDRVHDLLDMTLHLRHFVDSLGGDAVDVVGHSLGGLFAAELAALAPASVRRLVLVNPFGLWLDDLPAPDPFTLTPSAFARATWFEPAGAADAPTAFAHSGMDSMASYRSHDLANATKYLWPLPDRGTRRRLCYVQAPTLVLHGTADALVPLRYADAWAASIRGARRVAIERAGHLPMLEAEDEVLTAIRDFLCSADAA